MLMDCLPKENELMPHRYHVPHFDCRSLSQGIKFVFVPEFLGDVNRPLFPQHVILLLLELTENMLDVFAELGLQDPSSHGLLPIVPLHEVILYDLFHLLYVVPLEQIKSLQLLLLQFYVLSS